MCDNINSNPFAGLFTTVNDAVSFSRQIKTIAEDSEDTDTIHEESDKLDQQIDSDVNQHCPESEKDDRFDELIADVFGIAIHNENRRRPIRQLVFVDTTSIEQAIFERLLLIDPESKLISKENTKGQDLDRHVIQTDIVPYLFESYCRLQRYRISDGAFDTVENIRKIIVCDISTALQEPELFVGQEVHKQFVVLFKNGGVVGTELPSFISGIIEHLTSENPGSEENVIKTAFSPILDVVLQEATKSGLLLFHQYWFCILQTFASIEPLAKLVITHSSVKTDLGSDYDKTLLGSLLNLSCLPKTANDPYAFYDRPFQINSTIDGNIWTALDNLNESMHKVFHTLLKCSRDVRHMTLNWISDCLYKNSNRGKLSNAFINSQGIADITQVSDGFMLNLGNVLLRLCQPFCSKPNDSKLLKIDPTYCCAEAANESERKENNIHLKDIKNETCLIPTAEGHKRPIAKSFNFVTECFFITHRTLDLGYRVILEKLFKISQNLGRMQRMFNFIQNDNNPQVREFFTQRMETEMTVYLSLRASLLNPELLILLAKFHAATAFWLMQVNVHSFDEKVYDLETYAPNEFRSVSFPLSENVPETLKCVPEFVVENTVSFLCFLRRRSPNVFEEQGLNFLNPILTVIIALMESPKRLNNPHLRARLAEGLEALLPTTDEVIEQSPVNFGTFHRQQLFVTHPHRKQIVPNLINVFVSIEMTGQSVEFEQKFNYRRPMYVVMDYLWKIPEQQLCFKKLAEEAEANMEAIQPPLFLRFINLLMNDAVFLLDDALQNISQLRQLTNARENGEWNNLSPQDRERQELDLQQIGMIARFDNILGRKTIQALNMLTLEIKSIFCHPTLVDRIASMLNYLLLQLVGPNKKNLKIKDQKEYDFNPAHLVLNISEIYINLGQNENFILAVSQDGRSYSPELFKLASDVLVRIGGVAILGDLEEFSKRVEKAAIQKKAEEEILIDAPEDFLDPIMSTLMTDPVILPSSRITVDRQTIARHLLSDQTDPFNRSPLTMDMVKSDAELKNRIKDWIDQRKRSRDHNED